MGRSVIGQTLAIGDGGKQCNPTEKGRFVNEKDEKSVRSGCGI